MATIRTTLSSVVPSVTTPIVLGAMANASGGDLAGAVSRAGGLGFIGAGYYTPEALRTEVGKAYNQLGISDRASLVQSKQRANFGIGILTWRLTELDGGKKPPLDGKEEALPTADSSKAMQLVDELLAARPRALWLSFGDEQELVGWTHRIRRRDREINPDIAEDEAQALRHFVMIGREAELACAVEGCGADVLIVQGNEAGGHGHSESPPLSAIIAAVKAKLPSLKPTNATGTIPPLLGAGGLADGRSLASLLVQGCAGGVYGTRFLLTPEAQYSQLQKELLIRSKGADTKRTKAFDDARGTLGWPTGVDGRGINNLTVADYERDMDLERDRSDSVEAGVTRRRDRYQQAATEADVERLVIWSGTGVGGMTSIVPADRLVQQITEEATEAIREAQRYLAA